MLFLQALDTINELFAQVQNKEPLSSPDPELIAELHRLSQPEGQEERLHQHPLLKQLLKQCPTNSTSFK